MNGLDTILSICTQITGATRRIEELSSSIFSAASASPELTAMFENQRLDELEHLQVLLLSLTGCVMSVDNSDDGSAFAEGELTNDIGDKTDCKTEKTAV